VKRKRGVNAYRARGIASTYPEGEKGCGQFEHVRQNGFTANKGKGPCGRNEVAVQFEFRAARAAHAACVPRIEQPYIRLRNDHHQHGRAAMRSQPRNVAIEDEAIGADIGRMVDSAGPGPTAADGDNRPPSPRPARSAPGLPPGRNRLLQRQSRSLQAELFLRLSEHLRQASKASQPMRPPATPRR